MNSTLILSRRSTVRTAYALVAVGLLSLAVLELIRHSTGWWQLAAFSVGPDLALLVGAGRGLERGQPHPRAVTLYNVLHRFWGPAALAVAASFGLVPLGYLVGALAWGFHVALDRAVGYGLRTPDGFQRR
jgi:Domain of unknown function (DUF4260)